MPLTKKREILTEKEVELDEYLNEISKKTFFNEQEIELISKAHDFTRNKFKWKIRKDWTNTFYHSKRVSLISLLMELTNAEDIVVAILHDVIEDTDSDYNEVKEIFWKTVADRVETLSKKEWANFIYDIDKEGLNESEIDYLTKRKDLEQKRNLHHIKDHKEIEKIIIDDFGLKITDNIRKKARLLRNKEYFWKMNQLSKWDMIIKASDRLESLYTINWFWDKKKVERKIEETITYFLPVLKETLPFIYIIMVEEINAIIDRCDLELEKIKIASSISEIVKCSIEKILNTKNRIKDIQQRFSWASISILEIN